MNDQIKPSIGFFLSPYLLRSNLYIGCRPILPSCCDRWPRNWMVRVAKIEPLVTRQQHRELNSAMTLFKHIQSSAGILPRIVTETNKCITPWPVLKHIADKRKKDLRTDERSVNSRTQVHAKWHTSRSRGFL